MMGPNTERAAARVKQTGIVPILRGDFPVEKVVEIGAILLEAGVPVVEVTMNSRNAAEAIAALRRRFGDALLVGAGTVRSAGQLEEALAAGAEFTVAPNFDPASAAAARAADLLHLPGVFTATEAQNAFAAGCRMLKLFPSDVVGPSYLKALRAPLDDVEFVPTGGISADNLGAYVRAGAVAVGVGSALLSGPDQPAVEIRARARALRAAWEACR